MSNDLVPEYFDKTFDIIKSDFLNVLSNDMVFKDYLKDGNNLAILDELVSYAGSISSFYINKVVKNHYIDTSDIYETTHMLSSLKGYEPKGYVSSNTTLTISVGPSAGAVVYDTLTIPAWTEIESTEKNEDGNLVKFTTTTTTTVSITEDSFPFAFQVPVKQGEVKTYSYTGLDLSDNKLYLPSLNFDYDNDLNDDLPSIEVQVGNDIWVRVNNFYNEVTGLLNESNIYMFKFDKYQTYSIEFLVSSGVPKPTDKIIVKVLESYGKKGNVEENTIINPVNTEFIYNITTLAYLTNGNTIDSDYVTITHTAATGGVDPELIKDMKDNSSGTFHSQFRNVTSIDYIKHLEQRTDVVAASVWGEMEESPLGNTGDYNKIFITVIPDEWGTGTISISQDESGHEVIPIIYSEDYKRKLTEYLATRKIISTYDTYVLPDILNFIIKIGIKVKPSYSFSLVEADVKSKLNYYFSKYNRSFQETIKITDIIEYILNTNNISLTETFSNVKGIQYLLVRDIDIDSVTISEPDSNNMAWTWGDNTYGQLGNNDSNWAEVHSPVVIHNNLSFTKIVSNSNSIYGLKEDGTLWSWGQNDKGQLGDGTITNKVSPVSVIGNIIFSDIFCDGKTAIGIRMSDDTAWAWGYNTNGQLGVGDYNDRSSPTSVLGGNKYKKLYINGNNFVIGLSKSNQAWSWGLNTYGQLGDGTTIDKSRPVSVLGGISYKQIVVDNNYVYGLNLLTLTAWAWGDNTFGQLGNNTTDNYSSPISVAGGIQFSQLNSIGGIENETGNLWTWGANNYGQLGNGTIGSQSNPVSVIGNRSYTKFITDGASCFAINGLDGSAWSWGYNPQGNLGTGNATNYSSPVSVQGGISFKDIKMNNFYTTMGIQGFDTSLWAWGNNTNGQLGNNSIISYQSPVGIAGFTGVNNLTIGFNFVAALKDTVTEFPKYTVNESTYTGNNKLRDIALDKSQFPNILIDYCTFVEEE